MKTKDLTLIALLAILLRVAGTFRFPGIISGTEFFMSAPVALAIAANFGGKKYLFASTISCFLGIALGMLTILNACTTMIFALVVFAFTKILGNSIPVLLIAGPLASISSRFISSLILGVPFLPILISAIPGLVYTVILTIPCTKIFQNPILKKQLGDLMVKDYPLTAGGKYEQV